MLRWKKKVMPNTDKLDAAEREARELNLHERVGKQGPAPARTLVAVFELVQSCLRQYRTWRAVLKRESREARELRFGERQSGLLPVRYDQLLRDLAGGR